MQSGSEAHPSRLCALLESTNTPATLAAYDPGAVIYRQGDPCDSVSHIEAGRVRLSVIATGGKEAIVGVLRAGAFLGEETLGGFESRRETATAITPTRVLVVPKAHLMRLLSAEQTITDQLITHILARHAALEASLTDQLFRSSEQRVARALLVLAGCTGRPGRRCVLPAVSQTIIAEMVGTTRSHVNAFMGKFRKLGFIERHGRTLLVTPSLRDIVDGCGRSVPTRCARPHVQSGTAGSRKRILQ